MTFRQQNICQIMSTSVVSVGENDSLETINQIFSHGHFHHVLVIQDGNLVGLVSDRDVLKALSPNIGTVVESAADKATLEKRAHEIMITKMMVMGESATVGDAIDAFNEQGITCIPILNAQQQAIGIVSWRDILMAIPKD